MTKGERKGGGEKGAAARYMQASRQPYARAKDTGMEEEAHANHDIGDGRATKIRYCFGQKTIAVCGRERRAEHKI